MDDLMKCLYEFVTARRLRTLWSDPEYRELSQSVESRWNKIEEGLDKEQQRELRTLMEEVSAQNSVENEHFFRAVLSLSRELYALVRVP